MDALDRASCRALTFITTIKTFVQHCMLCTQVEWTTLNHSNTFQESSFQVRVVWFGTSSDQAHISKPITVIKWSQPCVKVHSNGQRTHFLFLRRVFFNVSQGGEDCLSTSVSYGHLKCAVLLAWNTGNVKKKKKKEWLCQPELFHTAQHNNVNVAKHLTSNLRLHLPYLYNYMIEIKKYAPAFKSDESGFAGFM